MVFAIQSDTSGYLEDELYTLQKMLGEFPASLTSSFYLLGLRDTESLVSKEDIPVGTIEFTRRISSLAGRYDIEVAYMLINSLREAEVVLEQEHDQEADNDHEIAD